MHAKLLALIAASLLPAHAGAGGLDLQLDLGGLDVAVAVVPKDNPDAIRIDNKTQRTISCSASFTGLDQSRTEKVTVKPGKSAIIRVPANRGNMSRAGELKCREKTPAR